MALLAWWSAPEAKLKTNFEEKNKQSYFVHMLQTLPVSSNSEVFIVFSGQNHTQIVVRGESTPLR